MGYRDYAKDYEIHYEEIPGRKKPKAIRVYVGPWFRFRVSPERIRYLRWAYTLGLGVIAAALLIPMCIDCAFTRTWYIQTPAVAAWIPWLLAAASTWRLWTAGERVDREHRDLLHDRMSGASLFLMGLCMISTVGCVVLLSQQKAQAADFLVCGCSLVSAVGGMALFALRKDLQMERIEDSK